jgi:hypothetical protein
MKMTCIMNKTIFTVGCVFLGMSRWSMADDSDREPKELKELRANYQIQLAEATKPVKDQYLSDLSDLSKSELNKGDIDGAMAVKSEMIKMQPELSFTGKWISHSDGVSIIQIKSDGVFYEDWNGNNHYQGHWEVDKDMGGIVATLSDNRVLHYKRNSDGHIIRDVGATDYVRVED